MRYLCIYFISIASTLIAVGCSKSGQESTAVQNEVGIPADQIDEYVAAQREILAEEKAEASIPTERNASKEGSLPLGESGSGETITAFLEICVDGFSVDMKNSFKVVKDGGYRVLKEAVKPMKDQKNDLLIEVLEAKATSPLDSRDGVCAIGVEYDTSSLGAVCEVNIHAACRENELTGLFIERVLLEHPKISKTGSELSKDSPTDQHWQNRYFTLRIDGSNEEEISLKFPKNRKGYVTLRATDTWYIEGELSEKVRIIKDN